MKPSKTQHTPTPEIVSAFLRDLAVKANDDKELQWQLHTLADSVYGWRIAVNSHAALLEALRTLTNAVEMEKLNPTNWHGLNGFIDMAKQVIKKLDSL